MNAAKRLEIFRRLHEDNPEPKTELAYSSPFELLIAVILSAQSTDVGVNKATAKLFPVVNTPAAIYALGVEGLSKYIKTIGLYNSKAKNVIETCRLLVERHGGEVPQTREALEALPGVGRKTANVVLNTAFRQLTMAVDTHIFRVSNRTGIARGKNVVEVEKQLMKFVPKLDGLEVICRLSSTKQATPFKVLVLTSQAPGHFSMRCMQAGAAGYVCKQQDLTELLSAIKAVLSGYSYFPNQALNSVRSTMGNASEADMVERLSGREMMVLQQLARGKTNKEIADGMFLSNKTVSTYKTRAARGRGCRPPARTARS
jgi:endonuclease-3